MKTLFVDFQTRSPIHSSENLSLVWCGPPKHEGIQDKEDTAHFTIQIIKHTLSKPLYGEWARKARKYCNKSLDCVACSQTRISKDRYPMPTYHLATKAPVCRPSHHNTKAKEEKGGKKTFSLVPPMPSLGYYMHPKYIGNPLGYGSL